MSVFPRDDVGPQCVSVTCLTVEWYPGRGAGLCGRSALGARVKGWLSEALVQKWTEMERHEINHTAYLHGHQTNPIFKPCNYWSDIEQKHVYLQSIYRLTCLSPPCYGLCGCWLCWLFLERKTINHTFRYLFCQTTVLKFEGPVTSCPFRLSVSRQVS